MVAAAFLSLQGCAPHVQRRTVYAPPLLEAPVVLAHCIALPFEAAGLLLGAINRRAREDDARELRRLRLINAEPVDDFHSLARASEAGRGGLSADIEGPRGLDVPQPTVR